MPIDEERQIDWHLWLNRLIFCYGCGRFGMPSKGKLPRGWKTLYQPHPEGRPGLHVCGPSCEEKIREAMTKGGPITEPLEMRPPPMPHEFQEQMREIVKGMAEEEVIKRQEEALKHLQWVVDSALLAAIEAKDGKPLTKREAIDVAAGAIMQTHDSIGMAVTVNVEIDDDGMAVAEVGIVGKRRPIGLKSIGEMLFEKTRALFLPGKGEGQNDESERNERDAEGSDYRASGKATLRDTPKDAPGSHDPSGSSEGRQESPGDG